MKNIAGIVSAFLPAIAFCAALPAEAESAATVVKVMTYNIRCAKGDRNSPDNNWPSRREDLARLVEKENPDVAGFQEVEPGQRKWLAERLPGYVFLGDSRNADRKSGEASPVAFRRDRFKVLGSGTFWLSETPQKAGSKGWDAACPRICTYAILRDSRSGATFAFANTHTDHVGAVAREKGMFLIVEKMKKFGTENIVFVGDHNCLETEKPARAVSRLLDNAMYVSETPPEGPWRTFNFWKWRDVELSSREAIAAGAEKSNISGHASDMKRIDYIYVSPGTRVLSYATAGDGRPGVKLYPSDHFPVVAKVVFKNERK